ncbi:hypothetical protein COU57_05600 [Candidatus Pacearchaeota archaeon CG10_big_fil_rev_8_21_14_0_10_32_14]|nr:MAG: hypothetical protein COU57_05600 [Candidatus Pacearchaeota archaeon CG10_big_fil_rev_8_21_14_0_10_32_14]
MEMIFSIKKEHETIKEYLDRLRYFIDEKFDFQEFSKTFKEFVNFWNAHEQKEERFFMTLDNLEFITKMNFEHKAIKGYKKIISMALETHYEPYIKVTLEIDGKMMINRIQDHIRKEEELLSKLKNNLMVVI